ncbi:MAG: phage holin family protein [Pseudomonadota bacterium]|uniref:phage holin family protein n=1 Tax=Sphingomonas sp. ERG5 TaxID=1381597 RepID=UPI00054C223F|nr:phage holin family protein [Sphingomonas sp. ERG5]
MDEQPSPDENSISGLFSRLIDDAERFVRAEIRLYRAQLFERIGDAKTAILLGVTAFLLAQSAFIALFVGLVLILARAIGPAWAIVIVIGSGLAVAAVLVKIAIDKIRKVTAIKDHAE